MPNIMDIIPGLVPSVFKGQRAFDQQRYLPGGLSLMGQGNLSPQQTQAYDAFFNEIGRWLSPGQHPTGAGVGPTAASAAKWGVDPNVLARAGWNMGPAPAQPQAQAQAPQAPGLVVNPFAMGSTTPVFGAATPFFTPNVDVSALNRPNLGSDYSSPRQRTVPTGQGGQWKSIQNPKAVNPKLKRPENWDAKYRR